MVVCQVNQEQELPTALSVVKTLGRLKTRMGGLAVTSNYRSIAQKIAGLFAQHHSSNVIIVVKKSRLPEAKINNIVIWSAEIKATSIKQASKLELGKAIKHLTRLYINGLHHIIRSLMFVNIAKRKAIQSGLTYHRITTENEMTGLIYANLVILYMTAISTRTLDAISKYTDVIRKRYAKFIGEDDWQAVTSVISEATAQNGK